MYEQFFGFREKPFNVTPDPRFLYLSPAHQEVLSSMLYGIKERRGFVSVIGEIGTGKTTLLHTLFRELDQTVTTVFLFNTKINFTQLLQNILIELDLSPLSNNKSLLINQLNDYLIEKLSLNENVALVIDEAQNLSARVLEEIRMLSNLETTKNKLIQILLVGQPELDVKLRSNELRQLKQRIAINCYLTPLNQQEQMNYISHRLFVAGCETKTIFSQKALELICNNARGIPRIINILCDNALITAYGKEIHQVNEAIVNEVLCDFHNVPILVEENNKQPRLTTIPKKSYGNKTIFVILLSVLLFLVTIIGISFYKNNSLMIKQFITSALTTEQIIMHKEPEPFAKAVESNTIEETNEYFIFNEDSSNSPSTNTIVQNNGENNKQLIIDDPAETNQTPSVLAITAIPNTTPPQENNYKVAIAKEGDIISALALREYGMLSDTLLDIIKRANPDILNLDNIEIGQAIILPALDINKFIVETEQGDFSLHVETFSSYDSALRLHKTMESKGYSPVIVPVLITNKESWYRVLIGDFPDRSHAIEFAKIANVNNSLTTINLLSSY